MLAVMEDAAAAVDDATATTTNRSKRRDTSAFILGDEKSKISKMYKTDNILIRAIERGWGPRRYTDATLPLKGVCVRTRWLN